ncbi:NAD(P)-binding domain-containing protein [Streptomyces mirabilis]
MTTVTLLHPGAMGAEVGAQAHRAGARVLHVPTGRGSASVERAQKAGLEAAESLGSALAVSDLVLSICPPHAAEDVAREVLEHAFTGVYVEANAISPDRALRIDAACRERGVVMVDGSIIGAPPGPDSAPRLYLSGDQEAVGRVAAVFEDTAVLARPLDAGVGAASALKMAFASFQKSARVLGLSGGSCRRRGAWHALPQALRAGGTPSGVVVGCRLPRALGFARAGGTPIASTPSSALQLHAPSPAHQRS